MPRVSFHKEVREACLSAGWEVWSTYNDKHKDDSRRVSYSRNGWSVPSKMKAKILAKTKAIVAKHNPEAHVYWHLAERMGYGMYDKLCVYIPK